MAEDAVPNSHVLLGWEMYSRGKQEMRKFEENLEEYYTWINETLEEIRKQMATPEVQLLPKTPSTKRANQAIIHNKRMKAICDLELSGYTPVEEVQESGRKQTKRQTRKKVASSEDEKSTPSENTTRSTRSARSTRSTRTGSTKTQNTRSNKSRTNVVAIQEVQEDVPSPVLNLEKSMRIEEGATTVSQDSVVILDSDSDFEEPPEPKRRKSAHGTPKTTRTPQLGAVSSPANKNSPAKIPGYRFLSVKSKAQAYQDSVAKNISSPPISEQPTATSDTKSDVVVETPPKTPEKTERETNVQEKMLDEQSAPNSTNKSSRRSSRISRKLSLSQQRSLAQQAKIRTSIRLSLAKQCNIKQSPRNDKTNSPSYMLSTESVRCKIRPKSPAIGSPSAPQPVPRTTRSKMRQPRPAPPSLPTADTDDEDNAGIPDSPPPQPPPRTTRSKMRLNIPPPPTLPTPETESEEDNEQIQTPKAGSAGYSTTSPIRSTRSKMRQLQNEMIDSPCGIKRPLENQGSHSTPRAKMVSNNCDSEEDVIDGTPSPKRAKIVKPVIRPVLGPAPGVASFLKALNKKPHNLNTSVTSFVNRNTPVKKVNLKDMEDKKRKELEAREKNDESRKKLRQDMLHKRAEDMKKKREERMLMVAKRREENEKKEKEMKKGLVAKAEDKKLLKEEKMKEERRRLKLEREKKAEEAEVRRRQEEEARQQKLHEKEEEQRKYEEMIARKKEFEEQERQKKLAEQRRLEEERRAEAEKELANSAERKRKLDEQRLREEELRKRKEEDRIRKEKEEKIRQDLEKQKEKERLQREDREIQKENERQKVQQELAAKREQEKKIHQEQKHMLAMIEKHNHALQNSTSSNTTATASLHTSKLGDSTSSNTTANASLHTSKLGDTSNMNISKLNGSYTVPKPTLPQKANSSFTVQPGKSTAVRTAEKEPESESYEITPTRTKPKSKPKILGENYDINDLASDDSTDDEEAPRKKIPTWATGANLKAALINQYYKPPNLDEIFDTIEPPVLSEVFSKQRPRFNRRTSSAIWDSPILKPSGKLPYE